MTRSFTLSTPIGAPASLAWRVLVDLRAWAEWNTLLPRAEGDLRAGGPMRFEITQPRAKPYVHRAVLAVIDPPRRLVLVATPLHPWLLQMEHEFELSGADHATLVQTWTVSGVLVPPLWSRLTASFARFSQLGDDLARRCALVGA